MTDPIQRWGHPDPDGSMHLYPLGPYVTFADHEAHEAAAVAAADQRGRAEANRIHASMLPTVRKVSYEQGQRDERERIRTGVEALDRYTGPVRRHSADLAEVLAVIAAAPQDKQ